jgi:hypothetical protein
VNYEWQKNPADWAVNENGFLETVSGGGNFLFTEEAWGDLLTDYVMTVESTFTMNDGKVEGYGIYFRATEDEDGNVEGYRFQFDEGRKDFVVFSVSAEKTTQLKSVDFPEGFIASGVSHTVQIEAVGDHFVVTLDPGTEDSFVALEFDDETYSEGVGGLRSWGDGITEFAEITVEPVD